MNNSTKFIPSRTLRLLVIVTALLAFVPAAQSALVLYLDIENQEMSLYGLGPYTDLIGDADYTYRIGLRTSGSTTGLFYSQSLPDDFADVGGLDSEKGSGPKKSSVTVRSNGKVLELQLAFPSSSMITEGYLGGGITFNYAGSTNFANSIGDGSGLTSKTLTAYMPDPDATFPFGSDFEIPIVTTLPAIPEPETLYALICGVGLLGLLVYRRIRSRRRRRYRHYLVRGG